MLGWIFLIAAVILCVLGAVTFPQIDSNGDYMSVIYFVFAVLLAFYAFAWFRLRPHSDRQITHMTELHSEMRCGADGCDFETWDCLNAVKSAEAHHRETGHILDGTRGYAVWVGSEVPVPSRVEVNES